MEADLVEQQIDALRSDAPNRLTLTFLVGIMVALLLLNLSAVIWDKSRFWSICLILIPVCVGLVWFKNAWSKYAEIIKVYDTKPPSIGEVSISLTSWNPGEGTLSYDFLTLVREQNHPDWEFCCDQSFLRITPIANTYSARVWRNDNGSPVLVATEDNILIPLGKARKISSNSCWETMETKTRPDSTTCGLRNDHGQ